MTPAERCYQLAGLRLRIVRARMLLQISGADRDAKLCDLRTFSRIVGDATEADTVTAFRAAQAENLQIAQAELDRLENGNTQTSTATAASRGARPEAKI